MQNENDEDVRNIENTTNRRNDKFFVKKHRAQWNMKASIWGGREECWNENDHEWC